MAIKNHAVLAFASCSAVPGFCLCYAPCFFLWAHECFRIGLWVSQFKIIFILFQNHIKFDLKIDLPFMYFRTMWNTKPSSRLLNVRCVEKLLFLSSCFYHSQIMHAINSTNMSLSLPPLTSALPALYFLTSNLFWLMQKLSLVFCW